MSISYYSWGGGGGGGTFLPPLASLPASFGASFPFLSSTFAGASEAADVLPPTEPRKSLTLLVDKVFANALMSP